MPISSCDLAGTHNRSITLKEPAKPFVIPYAQLGIRVNIENPAKPDVIFNAVKDPRLPQVSILRLWKPQAETTRCNRKRGPLLSSNSIMGPSRKQSARGSSLGETGRKSLRRSGTSNFDSPWLPSLFPLSRWDMPALHTPRRLPEPLGNEETSDSCRLPVLHTSGTYMATFRAAKGRYGSTAGSRPRT